MTSRAFVAHFVASATWVDSVAKVPAIARNTDDRTLLEFSFAKTMGQPTPFSIEVLRQRLKAFGIIGRQLVTALTGMSSKSGGRLSICCRPASFARALAKS